MRFGYLIPRAVLVLIVWSFFAFAFDPLIRRTTVSTGQTLAGAKVEVAEVRTSFFPPSLTLKNVRVANRSKPDTNLFEFDEFHVRMDGRPLLKQSFIIREGTITGLRWGTPRDESGLLEKQPAREPGRKSELVQAMRAKLDKAGSRWLDDLVNRAKLQMDPKQLETYKLTDARQKQWASRFKTLETRIRNLERQIKNVEKQVKNAKGNTFDQIAAYSRAAGRTNAILTESQRIRNEMLALPNLAQRDFRDIDDARMRDQQSVRQKMDIFRFDSKAISESLLGPELVARLEQATDWLSWARGASGALSGRPKPERFRGIDISFERAEPLPKFLVETLSLSGEAKIDGRLMPFRGEITGLTSDPAVHGKPVILNISGENNARFRLNATLDHTVKIPVHHVEFTYMQPEPSEFLLSEGDELSINVKAAQTRFQVRLTLTDGRVDGDVSILQSPVTIVAESASDKRGDVTRIVQSAMGGIRRLKANMKITGTLDEPQWTLESNLGEQLAAGLNRVLAQEIAVRRRELEDRIDAAARKQVAAFEKQLNDRYGQLFSQLGQNETMAKRLIEKTAGSGKSLDLNRLFK